MHSLLVMLPINCPIHLGHLKDCLFIVHAKGFKVVCLIADCHVRQQVAWANASLRLEAELPPLPERPSIGVFREDSYEAGCFPPMVCSNGASEEADQESEHPARPRLLKAVRGSVVVEQSHCGAATAASAGSDASAICNGSAVSDDSATSNSSAVSNASAVCNGSAVSDGSAVFNASAACNGSAVSDGRTASCTSSSGSHENLEALPSNANSIKCDSCSCTHIYHCGCQNRHPNQKASIPNCVNIVMSFFVHMLLSSIIPMASTACPKAILQLASQVSDNCRSLMCG
jgi:hypothetical protein